MLDVYEQIDKIKSFEISFTDSRSSLQKLKCLVKGVDDKHISIFANNRKNKHVLAKVGNEINVYIYTELGVFTAVSKIMKVSVGIRHTQYVLSPLEKSKHFQRREYFRDDMMIDANITIITKSEESNNYIVMTKTRNICGKGMSFLADYSIPDYASLIVELFFKERKVTTMAVPIHCQKIKLYNQTKLLHGFNFVDLSQKDIDFIVKKCFLHQLELRKNHSI